MSDLPRQSVSGLRSGMSTGTASASSMGIAALLNSQGLPMEASVACALVWAWGSGVAAKWARDQQHDGKTGLLYTALSSLG